MLEISTTEMKEIDRYAIESIGIPSIVLMESAALKVMEEMDLKKMNSFTIICANGNNGGDGLVVARRLILANKKVDLFIVGQLNQGTNDFQVNLDILKNIQVPFNQINSEKEMNLLINSLKENDLTVDAIFGIGLNQEVKGLFYQVIKHINQYSKEILSVDIPSGLDVDSGEILGIAVQANKTISFHQMKKGLLKNKEYSGEIIVADIGIPHFVTDMILDKRRE